MEWYGWMTLAGVTALTGWIWWQMNMGPKKAFHCVGCGMCLRTGVCVLTGEPVRR